MATLNLLSTKNLSRSFGGIHAVRNVNFDLPTGQIRALIGPNGAGKTTFVSLLCGRLANDSGQVFFDGKDVSSLPVHQRIAKGIAYTFQITSIFTRLSLYENIALAVNSRTGIESHEADKEIKESLSAVDLLARADQIAGDMSYGHQRLLEIAMGLAQKPKLLILDEPTQGLARSEISGFNRLIKSITDKTTVLLIEHNMDVVMTIANTITVLNFGEILAEGTPQEIQNNKEVQAAYLGIQNA